MTDRFVVDIAVGFDLCQIDVADKVTDDSGNVTFDVGTGHRNPVVIACGNGISYTVRTTSPDPAARFTLWVWSGEVGDTVDRETQLIARACERPQAPIASHRGSHYRRHEHSRKMGSRFTFTVQLVDENGDPVGPRGVEQDAFIGVVSKTRQRVGAPDTPEDEAFEGSVKTERYGLPEWLVPDRFTVTVTNSDTNVRVDDPDVRVQVTLEKVPGNDLEFIDITTPLGTVNRPPGAPPVRTSWNSAFVRFSDNDPRAAMATVVTPSWRLWVPGQQSRHSIRMAVVDQYLFRNPSRSYYVTASATGDVEHELRLEGPGFPLLLAVRHGPQHTRLQPSG